MSFASFDGNIDEIPHISVDNFNDTSKKVFFLSHCHADHTVGFKNIINNINWTGLCYTSYINAKIMEHENPGAEKIIKPLQIGVPEDIMLPANPELNLKEMHVTVTLIPAGHCLGSTMILFEGDKKVLYTGDFRISPNDIPKYRDLHEIGYKRPIQIDTLYVDTTFIENHNDFPKRTESIECLIKEIEKWLRTDNNKVAIRTSAKYGYEKVFNDIYDKLKRKIYVDDWKWRLYSEDTMKRIVYGVTNDPNDTDIHICRRRHNHVKCIPNFNEKFNFLYINLSAKRWNSYDPDEVPMYCKNNVIEICFATHCSRNELIQFVNYFPQKKTIGFPNKYIVNDTPKKVNEIVLSPVKKVITRKRKIPLDL